jgi:hypothetical protein
MLEQSLVHLQVLEQSLVQELELKRVIVLNMHY